MVLSAHPIPKPISRQFMSILRCLEVTSSLSYIIIIIIIINQSIHQSINQSINQSNQFSLTKFNSIKSIIIKVQHRKSSIRGTASAAPWSCRIPRSRSPRCRPCRSLQSWRPQRRDGRSSPRLHTSHTSIMLSEWRIHVLDSQSFPGFLIEAGTANKIGRLPTGCNLLVQNEAPSGKGSVSTPPPPRASPGRLRLVTWFFPGMPSGIQLEYCTRIHCIRI